MGYSGGNGRVRGSFRCKAQGPPHWGAAGLSRAFCLYGIPVGSGGITGAGAGAGAAFFVRRAGFFFAGAFFLAFLAGFGAAFFAVFFTAFLALFLAAFFLAVDFFLVAPARADAPAALDFFVFFLDAMRLISSLSCNPAPRQVPRRRMTDARKKSYAPSGIRARGVNRFSTNFLLSMVP